MNIPSKNLLAIAVVGAIICAPSLPRSSAADDAIGTPDQSISNQQVDADYRLAARDLVQFQVFEEPETLVVQRVSISGAITVPMLGLIQVAGQTLLEVQQAAEKAYIDKGFYVKPQVMVTVQAYAPRSVSVLGQVNHPEQIALPIEASRIGIMKAITLAEGFTRLARSDQVLVIRTVAGHEEQHTVNINNYLASRGSEPEFVLRPDDVVFVPERVF
jgi:protein involved in polysaccharide export with SLBB domain